ncbi:MAG: PspA/IM30 family protein, partial [Ilumatobacteraceae bacterium]|nr:PspA/IM30 family protein [Ilumatobacteraceae bacterium]
MSMIDTLKRQWKYLTAKLSGSLEEQRDPKVQLEQAITEAREQHKRLTEQATNVIASQKQAEIRLNGKLNELERLNANARQALRMADDAAQSGDAAKAASYGHTAETIASQLIQVEKDVESLKALVIESTQAAEQAKAAVQLNSKMLQDKIAQKSKLLSQLEQAKMQE